MKSAYRTLLAGSAETAARRVGAAAPAEAEA